MTNEYFDKSGDIFEHNPAVNDVAAVNKSSSSGKRKPFPKMLFIGMGIFLLFMLGFIVFIGVKVAQKSKSLAADNAFAASQTELMKVPPITPAPSVPINVAGISTVDSLQPPLLAMPQADVPQTVVGSINQAGIDAPPTVKTIPSSAFIAAPSAGISSSDERIASLRRDVDELRGDVKTLVQKLDAAQRTAQQTQLAAPNAEIKGLRIQLEGLRAALVETAKRLNEKEFGTSGLREITDWKVFAVTQGGTARLERVGTREQADVTVGKPFLGSRIGDINLGTLEVLLADGRVIR